MKDLHKIKKQKRQIRAKRTRSKIFGTAQKPRLSFFRSNKHIYVQLIDDEKGKTLAGASDLELPETAKKKKKEIAGMVGRLIAEKAESSKIKKVIFDKGSYKYHGLVKLLAEGARERGLEF